MLICMLGISSIPGICGEMICSSKRVSPNYIAPTSKSGWVLQCISYHHYKLIVPLSRNFIYLLYGQNSLTLIRTRIQGRALK